MLVTQYPSQRMRHSVRLLLCLALAATASLVAACRSGSTPAAPPVTADTWATVGARQIMRVDVDKAFERNRDMNQTLSDEEALLAKLGLLNDLITQELLVAKAPALQVTVADSEVDTALNDTKKGVTEEAYQQELTRRNLTANDLRDSLRRELLAQKVLDKEVTAKATVSDQEVTDFFNANKAQFNLTEDAYHLAQIVVTPVADAQIANRSGDDATTAQAAQAKAATLMQQLQMGGSFTELAMDYSEDPESAPRGGDLGLVAESAIRRAPAALRNAVLAMEPGRARVINDGGALRIVLLVSKEKAGQRDLTTPGTKDQITQALKARKEQVLRDAYLTTLHTDGDVVNYAARRVVAGNGTMAPFQGATP
jgi:peptidyl-prolyl cis-trans isomerase SurA